jgi:hypothetical protein
MSHSSAKGRGKSKSGLPLTSNGHQIYSSSPERLPVPPINPQGGNERTPLLRHAQPDHSQTQASAKYNRKASPDMLKVGTLWRPSDMVLAILKCSIAYLLASLFTFVPFLADLLSTSTETDIHGRIIPRPAYSAHIVATIVVYVRTSGIINH